MELDKEHYMGVRILLLFLIYVVFGLNFLYGVPKADSQVMPKKKIIVGGDFDYKPFTYLDSEGKPQGYEVDIIKEIAEDYNLDVEFMFTPWKDALENLEAGRVDLLLGILYTEQRSLVYDFTIPHSVEYYGIFVRSNSTIKELSDLSGKQIIALQGDASLENFIKPMGLSENLVLVSSLPKAIDLVSSGNHDVVLAPYSIGLETIKTSQIKNVEVVGLPLLPSLYRFAVKKGNSELLSILNEGIYNFKDSGKSRELRIKWQFHTRKEISLMTGLRYAVMVLVPILIIDLLLILWTRSLKKIVIIQTKKLNEKTILLEDLNDTKDKLFSIIAHDLKGPFTSILGLSELLLENIHKDDATTSGLYIKSINSSAQNTLCLLDNLLSWAQSQTGQMKFMPESINLQSVVYHILDFCNPLAKVKNISLNNAINQDIEVYADQNMLMVILRNLISNAIKFSNVGGIITITTIKYQNHIEITVSDNGVGMDEATRMKLFKLDAIYTSKGTSNEEGTGLGLILCKEFVEKHGGQIWVNSEFGKGSEFTFTLVRAI
jgi:signal transduction histidine kinase